jgi:uncharacterized protein YecT (DUF1311 family)
MKPLLLLALITALLQKPAVKPGKVAQADVIAAINAQSDCTNPANKTPSDEQLKLNHVEYFDFKGDGIQEAVVVASTCLSGTSGPDIHAVFGYDDQGKIYELPFAKPDRSGDMDPAKYGMLFYNRNYELSVEHGLLVEAYYDSTGRDRPLVIRYKWDGKQFVENSVEKAGPFKTSFDCAKAAYESEKQICYVKRLADLDVELSQLYQQQLRGASPEQHQALRKQQREWLATRDNECNFKFGVQCLEDLYKARIAELSKAR